MLKAFIVILTLLFPLYVIPAGNSQPPTWLRVKDIVFESPTRVSSAGYIVKLRLYYDKTMRIELVLSNSDTSDGDICDLLDGTKLPNTWDINGRIVKYDGNCAGGNLVLWPKKESDIKYAIDEFLTKSVVHIGPTTFSSKGFIEGYSEVRSYASYLE